jgi:hypothetical protein
MNTKKFNYLMSRLEASEFDLEVMEAKWRGEWPGSEWIKEARAQAGFK